MAISVPTMQELLEAGVHFGHKVSRGNPRMKPFVYGARDGVSIIDLAKSEEKLKEAAQFVYDLGKAGKTLLVVGTKKQAKELVEELSKQAGAYFVTSRWVGGLLTNFDEVRRNLKKLNTLQDEQEKGLLSRYTKKEQLLIRRKLEKYNLELGGVASMDSLPDALFIIDAVAELTAVKEAVKLGIKIVGFADSNCDPLLMDYPIPANDDGIKSLKIITEVILNSYGQGRKQYGADQIKEAKKLEEAKALELSDGVAEQAAVLEEEVEKKVLDESKAKGD